MWPLRPHRPHGAAAHVAKLCPFPRQNVHLRGAFWTTSCLSGGGIKTTARSWSSNRIFAASIALSVYTRTELAWCQFCDEHNGDMDLTRRRRRRRKRMAPGWPCWSGWWGAFERWDWGLFLLTRVAWDCWLEGTIAERDGGYTGRGKLWSCCLISSEPQRYSLLWFRNELPKCLWIISLQ